jgi:hypothetical protein
MTTFTARLNSAAALVALLVAIPVATVLLPTAFGSDTPALLGPVDDYWNDIPEGSATAGLTSRPNDPLAIEAYFGRESYRPGTTAVLHFESTLTRVRLQVFQVGPERVRTLANNEMNGVPVTKRVSVGRIVKGASTSIAIANWPSGLYFARLDAPGGHVGFAPFVVRPRRLGESTVAVVLPTRTWQAYNFRDDDLDGEGDTWYATATHTTAKLHRPFLNSGVPPHFKSYDLYFLQWLSRTCKKVDILSQAELDGASGASLRKAYRMLVFPGHHEYVTAGEYDAVEAYRDLGGSLVMLSANNFFWKIELHYGVMTRVAHWRDLGRPESALLGVQYIGYDMGQHRGAWQLRKAPATQWLLAGTGSTAGDAFSNAGIEIDHTTPSSPKGTQVIGEIPNLFGPGMTAQMTYYSTSRGAQVFSAGAFSLAGSIRQRPVARLVENIWWQFAGPGTKVGTGRVH